MALYQNDVAVGKTPMPIGSHSDVQSLALEFVTTAAIVNGDVFDLGFLPADHVPVDCVLDCDDLDTGGSPTITTSVGILNAAKTAVSTVAADGGAAWIANSAAPQTGVPARPTTNAIWRVQPNSTTDRSVGVVVTAGPATSAAAGVKVRLILSYRPAYRGK